MALLQRTGQGSEARPLGQWLSALTVCEAPLEAVRRSQCPGQEAVSGVALGHRSSFHFFRAFPADLENHWLKASLGYPIVEPQLRPLMRALGNLIGV